MRVGINGFGRMGRLALRAGWEFPDLEIVAVNEPHATAETMALLTEFDTVQGRWDRACRADDGQLVIGDRRVTYLQTPDPAELPWDELGVDLVLECSGKFKTSPALQPHFARGAKRVVVSAAVKDIEPNIVMGVNHDAFDLATERIVSAASCTTNCLAPVVRVIHDALGIERGVVTTIHDPTNTQRVVDAPHKDARRARAAQSNLIPTSSNSSYAVTMIIPELAGKLESIAVRVPVLNSSLTDCVFAVARDTSIQDVNAVLREAAASQRLSGILGYEERPLVSSDYARDPRSSIVDALSTRVTDRRLVKILAWYDNEWGYANRLVELAGMVAAQAAWPMTDTHRDDANVRDYVIITLTYWMFTHHGRRAAHARAAVSCTSWDTCPARDRGALPLLRVLRRRHELPRRLARPTGFGLRFKSTLFSGLTAAARRTRHCSPAGAAALTVPLVMVAQGVLRHRQGPYEDELEELHQVRRAPMATNAGSYAGWPLLTGSKNALKGAGFFLGGALLASGPRVSPDRLLVAWPCALATRASRPPMLPAAALPSARAKAEGRQLARTCYAKNVSRSVGLSAARLSSCSRARDIWFVLARTDLPC